MKRGESTISFVEKLLRENLDIPPATELHIVTTQRAPQTCLDWDKIESDQISPLWTKEDILHKAWIKKRHNFDHYYLTAILNKRQEYNDVKRAPREKKIHFQTLYPSRLRNSTRREHISGGYKWFPGQGSSPPSGSYGAADPASIEHRRRRGDKIPKGSSYQR